jgi:hypothetical protein
MTDSDRLERRIARLAEEIRLTGDGRRVLAAADPEALLGLLLREAAETVLPRCLSIRTDADSSARIEVAGGRILGFETATAQVSGRGQFTDPDAIARALGDALRGFVGTATSLTIASTRLARRPGPDDLRCPPDRVAMRASGDAGGLTALARALSAQAVAWALCDPDGNARESLGTGPDLTRLARFVALAAPTAATELDRLPGGALAPGCLVCGNGDGSSLLYARDGGMVLAMLLPTPALAALAPLWQRHCGG